MAEDKKAIIKNLLEKGKKNGKISYQEIADALEEVDLDHEKIEKVYETLETMGVEIIGSDLEPEKDDDIPLDEIEEVETERGFGSWRYLCLYRF